MKTDRELLTLDISTATKEDVMDLIYLALGDLKDAVNGNLYTTSGMKISPLLTNWGTISGGVCYACLAGCLMLSRLECNSDPDLYLHEATTKEVASFLNGIRNLGTYKFFPLISQFKLIEPDVDHNYDWNNLNHVIPKLEELLVLNNYVPRHLRAAVANNNQSVRVGV